MPMIAFIGVRISWLIVATKVVFASEPARAASCERRSSSSACFRSVMSRTCAVNTLAARLRDGDRHFDRKLLAAAAQRTRLDAPADEPRFTGGQIAGEVRPVR